MANFRVAYPLHYIAIGEHATQSGIPVHGLQSLSLNTNFSLEQVFELGQLDIYENIEALPAIELTAEKVLDGYPLMYHLGTRGATSKTLLNRTNQMADIILSVFSDSQDNASGTPEVQAYCSGMYVSSLSYRLPVEGNCSESVTFVGNDKVWRTSSFLFNGHFDGNDSPASGVQRRQMVLMGSGNSVFPSGLPGITPFAPGSGYNILSAGQYGAHIQDIEISVNLGREDLYELGRRRPYYKYASFPTAVDCSISMTAGGENPGDLVNADSDSTSNISDESILIKMNDGMILDLGDKNKLQSVSYSGGDTGGGVVSIQFSYQNFNRLDVTSPADPEGLV